MNALRAIFLGLLVVLLPQLRGQSLQFSSVFGGSGSPITEIFTVNTNFDVPQKIAVDVLGNIYVTGTAFSTDFPLVRPLAGSTASTAQTGVPFVSKLDPTGTKLLYSTFIGPPQYATSAAGGAPLIPVAIAVDAAGDAYVAGTTTGTNFPVPSGQAAAVSAGLTDVFVIKLDIDGNLLSSFLLGGSGIDQGSSIALDSSGSVYVAGTTASPNFPVTAGAFRSSLSSSQDVFLVKLDAALSKVVYGTYLGPGSGPLLSLAGNDIYIGMSTNSSGWPVTSGPTPSICAANCSAVLALRFSVAASKIIFARYLYGGSNDTLGGMASGPDGSLYLTGSTSSTSFPVTVGSLQVKNLCTGSQCTNAFVTRLAPDGSAIVYSTYFGGSGSDTARGIAVDSSGSATVTGLTSSSDFPTLNAIQVSLFPIVCIATGYEGNYGPSTFCKSPSGFVSRIDASGSTLASSSYIGGVADSENILFGLSPHLGPFDLALDASGNVYVAGTRIGLDAFAITPQGAATIVKIAPQGKPIFLTKSSITDSTLFQPGLPQAGGLATAFVSGLDGIVGTLTANVIPLPTTLRGVTVKVNGEAAPILAVAQAGGYQQINFQVPFDQVGANWIFRVEIEYNGSRAFIGATPLPPSLIAYPNSGGAGAVLHGADSSPVTSSNPIVPGEVIVIYGTGFGQVSPAAESGVPFAGLAKANAGGVTLGGQDCPTLYAGPSPGSIGLYQINCQTPLRTPNSNPVKTSLYVEQSNVFLVNPLEFSIWNSNSLVVWTR